jgi:hypothetical protein
MHERVAFSEGPRYGNTPASKESAVQVYSAGLKLLKTHGVTEIQQHDVEKFNRITNSEDAEN